MILKPLPDNVTQVQAGYHAQRFPAFLDQPTPKSSPAIGMMSRAAVRLRVGAATRDARGLRTRRWISSVNGFATCRPVNVVARSRRSY